MTSAAAGAQRLRGFAQLRRVRDRIDRKHARPLDFEYGGMRRLTVEPPGQPGTSIVREPTEQPYGVRDCSFGDPAGTLVRIQEQR